MMNFSTLQGLTIPEGVAIEIRNQDGIVIWNAARYSYVSLGDSIAAGHGIRSDAKYHPEACYEWQYGTAGVNQTEIISGCYTDLIAAKLQNKHGRTSAKSFARSGDKVKLPCSVFISQRLALS